MLQVRKGFLKILAVHFMGVVWVDLEIASHGIGRFDFRPATGILVNFFTIDRQRSFLQFFRSISTQSIASNTYFLILRLGASTNISHIPPTLVQMTRRIHVCWNRFLVLILGLGL